MIQYIAITDNTLWDIIVNGKQKLEKPQHVEGKPDPPTPNLTPTVNRAQERALNILLSAILYSSFMMLKMLKNCGLLSRSGLEEMRLQRRCIGTC